MTAEAIRGPRQGAAVDRGVEESTKFETKEKIAKEESSEGHPTTIQWTSQLAVAPQRTVKADWIKAARPIGAAPWQ